MRKHWAVGLLWVGVAVGIIWAQDPPPPTFTEQERLENRAFHTAYSRNPFQAGADFVAVLDADDRFTPAQKYDILKNLILLQAQTEGSGHEMLIAVRASDQFTSPQKAILRGMMKETAKLAYQRTKAMYEERAAREQAEIDALN